MNVNKSIGFFKLSIILINGQEKLDDFIISLNRILHILGFGTSRVLSSHNTFLLSLSHPDPPAFTSISVHNDEISCHFILSCVWMYQQIFTYGYWSWIGDLDDLVCVAVYACFRLYFQYCDSFLRFKFIPLIKCHPDIGTHDPPSTQMWIDVNVLTLNVAHDA